MMMSQKEIPKKYECERYKLTTQDKEFCHKRKNVSAEGCYECDGLVEPIKELKENKDMDIVLCKECQQRSTRVRGLCKKCYQKQWAKNKKLKANYICIEPDCPNKPHNIVSQKGRRCQLCANRIKAKKIKEALIVAKPACAEHADRSVIVEKPIEDPIETDPSTCAVTADRTKLIVKEVDFTNYPELYKMICKDALGYFRPVAEHIVALTAQVWECYFYDEKEWETGFYKSKKKLYLMTEEIWMPENPKEG